MKPITYLSNQDEEYILGLDQATTLDQLNQHINSYFQIAYDAIANRPVNDAEFEIWRAGLLLERKGQFAGTEWTERFGCILLPEILLRVGMVSVRFGVPWGMAFLRMEEAGRIYRDDIGVASWAKD